MRSAARSTTVFASADSNTYILYIYIYPCGSKYLQRKYLGCNFGVKYLDPYIHIWYIHIYIYIQHTPTARKVKLYYTTDRPRFFVFGGNYVCNACILVLANHFFGVYLDQYPYIGWKFQYLRSGYLTFVFIIVGDYTTIYWWLSEVIMGLCIYIH